MGENANIIKFVENWTAEFEHLCFVLNIIAAVSSFSGMGLCTDQIGLVILGHRKSIREKNGMGEKKKKEEEEEEGDQKRGGKNP